MTTAAQTVGVAVLTHNNENTMFYGNKALQQAVEAAIDGDVISLSPGLFEGCDLFSKSGLTIIGSGMDEGNSQTILTGFRMQANDNTEKLVKLTLKNVYIPSLSANNGNYELYLKRCRFTGGLDCSIASNESSVIEMADCVSKGVDHFDNCKLNAYNCVFNPVYLAGDATRERILTNCILFSTPSKSSTATISNSIIIDGYAYCFLPTGVRATNCKAIVNAQFEDYLGNQKLTNERLPKDFEAFVEGSFYELKPELASIWVDENSEQIGIYGGPEPFSALPDAPRFTKFNVPTRTDADGKLPVEIEIAMPEK